ncbi:hypothetical protein MES5069_480027 [Mesorhizobium escarrei]|uniref:Propionyl-coenzyme A carboxylase alpha polypeptide n=1 Tax=Mesorhizobium escarrei TaxID=666018 RepID=A0ABM9E8Y6_9HYPH|nr:hypothetical protein MES5069_480027 [Mesorhizobium escarrei]
MLSLARADEALGARAYGLELNQGTKPNQQQGGPPLLGFDGPRPIAELGRCSFEIGSLAGKCDLR